MAGVKGRSGGARPGAGRKKKPENEGDEFAGSTAGLKPLEALEFFMNEPEIPVALRIKAAGLAAPFRHKKLGEGGTKKDEEEARKKSASAGRFGTRQAPKLVAAGGKKV